MEVARCLHEAIGEGRVDLIVVSTPDSESAAKIGPRIEENLEKKKKSSGSRKFGVKKVS